MWLALDTCIITDKWISVTKVNTIVLLEAYVEALKVVDKPLKAINWYLLMH